MVPAGSLSFTVSDRVPGPAGAGPTVVWLRGAHDASSDGRSAPYSKRAMASGAVALVLDLSEMAFMVLEGSVTQQPAAANAGERHGARRAVVLRSL